MHKSAAQKSVEVLQEIDWVLGEVGVAVVFERENLGREGIGWSRAAEIYTATREGQPDEPESASAISQAGPVHRRTGPATRPQLNAVSGCTQEGGEFDTGCECA